MKCASILSFATILTATFAFGQAVVSSDTKLALAMPAAHMDATNCPVGLRVKHGPGLATSRSADGPTINKPLPHGMVQLPDQNQAIRLTMTNLSPQSIVSAQVVVHGFSNKWRYVPLSGADPDLETTVDVALDVRGNGEASRNLSLSRFTAISAVDVNAITYADGSSWRTSTPGNCSATPDLFMLVNAEQ
jgi:hypothetical protein